MGLEIGNLGIAVDTKDVDRGIDRLTALATASTKVGTESRKSGGLVSRYMKKAGDDTAKAGATGKKAGGLIKRSFDEANGSVQKLGKTGSGLTSVFAPLRGLLGGLGVAALAREVFNTQRGFETMQASLKTVTGSAEEANKQFGIIEQFATTTPYTLDQSVEGFIKLKSLGLDPSTEAMKSYGNTAAAMGKDMMQMIEAVADASTGEFERLKEFGIKAKKQKDEVSFTFQGVTTTVKNNSEEITKYLQAIGNNQFGGAMADQMKTLEGKIANLSDTWSKLQRKFMEATGMDISVKGMVVNITSLLESAIGVIDQVMIKWDQFKKDFKTSDEIEFKILRELADGAKAAIGYLAPLIPYIGPLAAGLTAVAATSKGVGLAIGAMKGIAGLAGLMNPVGIAIAAIAAGAIAIHKNWDTIGPYWTKLWNGIKNTMDGVLRWWDGLKNAFNFVIEARWPTNAEFRQAGNFLLDSLKGWWLNSAKFAIDIALPTAISLLNKLTDLQAAIGRKITSSAPYKFLIELPVIGDMIKLAANIVSGLHGYLDRVAKYLISIDLPTAQEILDKAKQIMNSLMQWWEDVSLLEIDIKLPSVEDIKAKVGDIKSTISDGFGGAKDAVGNAMSGMADEVKKKMEISRLEVESSLKWFDKRMSNKLYQAALENGGQIPAGLAAGMKAGQAVLEDVSRRLADTPAEVFEYRNEIRSPARRFIKLAQYVIAGLAGGLTDGIPQVAGAMDSVSDEMGRKMQELTERVRDGIYNSFKNADSIKDVFKDLGAFVKDWLKEKIAYFAANKITAFIGMGTAGGSAGGGIMDLISGGGSGGGFDISGILGGLGGGGSSGGAGGLADLLGGSESLGGLEIAGTSLGGLGMAAAGGYAGGKAIGSLLGRENELSGPLGALGATIGMAMGGPLGAALGAAAGGVVASAFGTKWAEVSKGFELSYTGGAVQGQNFSTEERERSWFRGTKSRTTYSELDGSVSESVNSYFDQLNNAVIASANALGIEGANHVLDGFEVATQQFSGENTEEELANWLSESTRNAYQMAYDQLGPELQSYVQDSVDMINGPVEDITGIFDQMGVMATSVVPQLQAAGLNLGDTFDAAIVSSMGLTEAMGGGEEGLKNMGILIKLMGENSDVAALQMQTINDRVIALGASTISTDTMLGRFLDSLDRNGESFTAFSNAIDTSSNSGRVATEQINEFTNGINEATGKVNVNLAAMLVYRDNLDLSTGAGRQAAAALEDLTNNLGINLDAMVANKDALIAEILATDGSTEAGQARIAQLISEVEAIAAVEAEQARLQQVLTTVKDASQVLNLTFDPMAPNAIAASDALVQLMGGIEGFNSATQSYYNDFYTAEERKNMQLAQSVATVEDFKAALSAEDAARVSTREGFREYVEGLDLQTASGQEAFRAAMAVSDAMSVVTDTSDETQQALAALPEGMVEGFRGMNEAVITGSSELIANTQAANDAMYNDQNNALLQNLQMERDRLDNSIDTTREILAVSRTGNMEQLESAIAAGNGMVTVTRDTYGNIETVLDSSTGRMLASVDSTTGVITTNFDAAMTDLDDRIAGARQAIQTQAQGITTASNGAGSSLNSLGTSIAGLATRAAGAMSSLNNSMAALNAARANAESSAQEIANLSRQVVQDRGNAWQTQADAFQQQFNIDRRTAMTMAQAATRGENMSVQQAREQIAIWDRQKAQREAGQRVTATGHVSGKDFVPYDNYPANLHYGERVLTREENKSYMDPELGGNGSSSDRAELKAIKRELEMLRKETSNSSKSRDEHLARVSTNSSKQVYAINKLEKTTEREKRRVGK